MGDPGTRFYAALDYMNNNGALSFSGKGYSVDIISRAFIKATSECTNVGLVAAAVDVNCASPIDYSASDACRICRSLASFVDVRKGIDGDAPKADNPIFSPATCDRFCVSCFVENVDQSAYVHLDASCEFDEAFYARMQQALQNQVADTLQESGRAIQAVYGAIDVEGVKTSFSTQLKTVFRNQVSNRLRTAVQSFQALRVLPGSASVVVSGVTQGVTVSVVASMLSRVMSNIDIYNASDVQAQIQSLNTTDSTSDLVEAAKKVISSVRDVWDEVEGKILFIAVGAVLLAVIGVAVRFVWKKRKG